ncbi:hypothetical protein NMY22_g5619 [Coprinellus aureogranulatus]|nr:hypothetical protein NMY22_g5619 [Coprinellus aureogranulatus]
MVNYGGDEVAALVVDIGTSSLRAGYAGDDTPKSIIPTSYGYIPAPAESNDVSMADGTDGEAQPSTTKPKYANMYIGQNGPSIWRPGMEIGNPIQEGLSAQPTLCTTSRRTSNHLPQVHDFNPIPPLIRHALEDPAWNSVENRERMAEIMFEEFNVPAFYIANTGVLNAFAAGKGSALVIDIGQSMASVTPVVDGFVLRKGLARSSIPKFIQSLTRGLLANHRNVNIDLWPHQLIASKMPVDLQQMPRYTLRQEKVTQTTESWKVWAEQKEVEEWIQSVAAVPEQGWNDQLIARSPAKVYEFPTGYSAVFGAERFQVGEHMFYNNPGNRDQPKNIMALVQDALRTCDPELRGVLASNVVLTGGGSLVTGVLDRLNAELPRMGFAHAKIHAPGNPIERRYGGWLGGSILASLGTFHQLWISKEEWQEHGKAIVGQRCK